MVRLVRDVRVNTELYTALLNNTQQLKLIRAGKVGNVRILDAAVQPDKPVAAQGRHHHPGGQRHRPDHRPAVGPGAQRPVRRPVRAGVERYTGLPVLAAIPYSDIQDKLWRRSRRKNATVPALAQSQSNAPPIESLRGFRNVLQASPVGQQHGHVHRPRGRGGQSFLSANFAFIQGGVGKRVLLIDADFRKASSTAISACPRRTACSRCCPARSRWSRCAGTACPGAWISFRRRHLRPVRAAGLARVRPDAARAVHQYDMVVLDTAPVLSSPDAQWWAAMRPRWWWCGPA